jgi:hypothetical protein
MNPQIKRVIILLLWIAVSSLFTKVAVGATERVEEGRCMAGNASYCKEASIDPTSQPQCSKDCPVGNSGQPEQL